MKATTTCSIGMVLASLAPLGAVAVAPQEAGATPPTNAEAEVVVLARGPVELQEQHYRWHRQTFRVESAGTSLVDDEPSLLYVATGTVTVAGAAGTPSNLDADEAIFLPAPVSTALSSGDSATVHEITIEPAEDLPDAFVAAAGSYELSLVRTDLRADEAVEFDIDLPALVLVLQGSMQTSDERTVGAGAAIALNGHIELTAASSGPATILVAGLAVGENAPPSTADHGSNTIAAPITPEPPTPTDMSATEAAGEPASDATVEVVATTEAIGPAEATGAPETADSAAGGGEAVTAETETVLDLGMAPTSDQVAAASTVHALGSLDASELLPRFGLIDFPTFTNGLLVGLDISADTPADGTTTDEGTRREQASTRYLINGEDIAGYRDAVQAAVTAPDPLAWTVRLDTRIDQGTVHASASSEKTTDVGGTVRWRVDAVAAPGQGWSIVEIERERQLSAESPMTLPEPIVSELSPLLEGALGADATVIAWSGHYGIDNFAWPVEFRHETRATAVLPGSDLEATAQSLCAPLGGDLTMAGEAPATATNETDPPIPTTAFCDDDTHGLSVDLVDESTLRIELRTNREASSTSSSAPVPTVLTADNGAASSEPTPSTVPRSGARCRCTVGTRDPS